MLFPSMKARSSLAACSTHAILIPKLSDARSLRRVSVRAKPTAQRPMPQGRGAGCADGEDDGDDDEGKRSLQKARSERCV
eukprot:112213-Pleurochrysis_carterae.AAC.2